MSKDLFKETPKWFVHYYFTWLAAIATYWLPGISNPKKLPKEVNIAYRRLENTYNQFKGE